MSRRYGRNGYMNSKNNKVGPITRYNSVSLSKYVYFYWEIFYQRNIIININKDLFILCKLIQECLVVIGRIVNKLINLRKVAIWHIEYCLKRKRWKKILNKNHRYQREKILKIQDQSRSIQDSYKNIEENQWY